MFTITNQNKRKCSHIASKGKHCIKCSKKQRLDKILTTNEIEKQTVISTIDITKNQLGTTEFVLPRQTYTISTDPIQNETNNTINSAGYIEHDNLMSNEEDERRSSHEEINFNEDMEPNNVIHNEDNLEDSNDSRTNNIATICYCANCKRQNTMHHSDNSLFNDLYDLIICDRIITKTSLRRKFSTLSVSQNGGEIVLLPSNMIQLKLCIQCYEYLTLKFTCKNEVYKKIWQVIFWKILSSPTLYKKHDAKLWALIPLQWRKWWLGSLQMFLPNEWYTEVTINEPKNIIVDITLDKKSLETSIKNGILSEIIENCDKHLLPLVKCPWGCTEYFHVSGEIAIQNIFWRYIGTDEMEKMMSQSDQQYAKSITIGSRNDYLSLESDFEVEYLLWNPQWRIAPSICFIDSCPMFVTCRNHNKGCKKLYLHVPKHPFGVLPAKSSDQVSPAVVVPRTIRATKAHKFSHAFNMEQMRCNFNGVDTLSVTDKPLFNNDSILSDVYESVAIKGRKDIKSYVSQLSCSSKHLAIDLTNSLCDRANNIIKDFPHHECGYDKGSTCLPVKESIKLQREIKKGTRSTVSMKQRNGDIVQKQYIPKWPIFLYYVHATDTFGSSFPSIPSPSKEHEQYKGLLWTMSMLHICVQEIWEKTATNVTTPDSEWNGWLLLYLTELSFPHLLKKKLRQNIFSWNSCKSKCDKERKILEQMNVINTNPNVQNEIGPYEISQDDESDTFLEINEQDNNNNMYDEYNNVYDDHNDTSSEYSSNEGDDISDGSIDNDTIILDNAHVTTNTETDGIHNGMIVVQNMNLELNFPIRNNEDNDGHIDETQNNTNNHREVGHISSFITKIIELFEKEKSIAILTEKRLWTEVNLNEDIHILIFINPIIINNNGIESDRNDPNFLFNILPLEILSDVQWDLRLVCLTSTYCHRTKNTW